MMIGQFPPPIHGLSKALITLYNSSIINEDFELDKVNITNNRLFMQNLKKIRNSNSAVYYLTISHSKLGNLRDLIIMNEILKKNKKLIIHYHGGHFKSLYQSMNYFQKKLNFKMLNKADKIIVLGETLISMFDEIVPISKISICENFVEEKSLLTEEEIRTKFSDINKETHVLYLSNLITSKGYLDVLKAYDLNMSSNVFFHFAGGFLNKLERQKFEKEFKKIKRKSNVEFYGVVDGELKRELIKKADIFILPTYYHIEGQPISIIEAMANGLAIITTKHSGIPDIVSDKNGIFVEKKNPQDILEAINYFHSNKDELKKIGLYNREYALKKFQEKHYINRMNELFLNN